MLAAKQPAGAGRAGRRAVVGGNLDGFSPNCYFVSFPLPSLFISTSLHFGFPERAEWDPGACLEKRDPFLFIFLYTLHLIERKPTVPLCWPAGRLWVGTWNCLTYPCPIPPTWAHTYLWIYLHHTHILTYNTSMMSGIFISLFWIIIDYC